MIRALIVLKIIFLVYISLLLPGYIYFDMKLEQSDSLKLKMTLSTTFCLTGLIGTTLNDFNFYTVFILFGLIFAMVGDYYLIFINSDTAKFIKGIMFFGITHIFFIASMYSIVPFTIWNLIISIFIYVIVLYFIDKQKVDFRSAKYPLYIYSMMLILMTVKAIFMIFVSPFTMQSRILFASGALLFFISDIFLGTYVYINQFAVFKIFNSITYFIGQLLIAASLFYL